MEEKPSTKSSAQTVPAKPVRRRTKQGVYLIKMVYVPDDAPDAVKPSLAPEGQCEVREGEE